MPTGDFLGHRQKAVLSGMERLPGRAWYVGADRPLYGTRKETAEIIASLVRRGLVTEEIPGKFVLTTEETS